MNLALVVLLGFTLFSCGSPAPTETLQPGTTANTTPTPRDPVASGKSQQSITFATDADSLSAYRSLAEEFNAAHPQVTVTVKDISEVPGDWQRFSTPAMMAELASSVDTFILQEQDLWAGLDANALLDLNPLVDFDASFEAEDFFPGTLDRFRGQNSLWGLPARMGNVYIFYKPGAFAAAGIPQPEPGWTWDDFLTAADQMSRGEGSDRRYGFVDLWGGRLLFNLIQQRGGDLLDRQSDPPVPTLDDPLVAEAIRFYIDLALKYNVMPKPADRPAIVQLSFSNRREGLTMWTDILSNWPICRDGTVSIAPFPEDARAANPVGVSGYAISASTAHPQAAWEWIEFLTQQDVLYQEGISYLPARRSAFDHSPYLAQMDEQSVASIRYALLHPAPPLTRYETIVQAALNESLEPVWIGQATVEDALRQAQALAVEQLEETIAADAAATAPPPVRPVPTPTPKTDIVSITFAIPEAYEIDLAPYRALSEQFHQRHAEIAVTVQTATLIDFSAVAESSDCFIWSNYGQPDDWQEYIVQLQPLVEQEGNFSLDDFYPQGLHIFREEGALWALPLFLSPELIYFNRDLFDAAGQPYPQPDWTWEDFRATILALTGGTGGEKQYGFAPYAGIAPDALNFVWQHGGALVDDPNAPTVSTFNHPDVVEALEWYTDLALRYQAMPPPLTDDLVNQAQYAALIRSGRVAMWTNIPQWGDPGYDFPVGVAPLPRDRQGATGFDSWGGYISARSPHPEACWAWLMTLSDHLTNGPGVPARRSLAEGADFAAMVDTASRDAYLTSVTYQDVQWDRWQDRTHWTGWILPWFRQAVQDALIGQQSPVQALDEAQAQSLAFLHCLADPSARLDDSEAQSCAQSVDPTYPSSENAP